ncbi:ABC transporter periplasmic protein family 3 [Niallia circulans]|uniref:ABC transporter substrate-binding protein n=1 Tax=Niallia circulans TaxID=1397 RepID=A0A0J1LF88_NIACI|nr:transporter substrate-binding domain-containing protein [Niallia circulans]KLV27655.1 ABC transporter substrate-binding protein [Niallia circulans]MCM2981143.1 transporter substrate-binding domain-containing protein [Niallia circulans]MDR4316694.1 transporter substrate-binding domain-containing protein [Niallia circulans]MED3840314.1 transporter substrate-binding domain-containing protein [Niallia circulans]MED4242002.1 transporter substrate-binding domain-containing protein [Niallia circul
MRNKLLMMMVLMVSAMLLLAGCGTSDKQASGSSDDNTFRVGLEAGYAPFNWTQNDDSNGAVKIKGSSEYASGYDVEIAKKVAEGLGKELVIVKTEWDGLVPALVSGKIDAIIAGMSPTADRKETVDFSDSYYKSNLVMVVKKGSKYEKASSIQDFKGAKVTAQLNTFHYSVIDQIEGVEKKTAMDNFPAMRVALESGVIDGYVSERPEAVSASTANDKFVMVEFKEGFKTSEEDTSIAVGLQKDSDLTEKINKILADIPEKERTSLMDNAIKNQPAAE